MTDANFDPRKSLPPGAVIDQRFEVIKYLGGGGGGIVYRAKQLGFDREIAVKFLLPAGEAYAEDRFLREASILSQIKHKNIITFYGFGVWRGAPYIAMEHLSGITLEEKLERSSALTVEQLRSWFQQICSALSCAHKHGIIHRDLKPENIFLVPSGQAGGEQIIKIIDFGLAAITDASAKQRLTAEGLAVGTVYYMSPEQCMGEKSDARSDIYAVGCILYRVLAGAVPFSESSETTAVETMMRHLHAQPPQLKALRPADEPMITRFQAVIARCLEKAAGDRYPDASELERAILQCCESLPAEQLLSAEPTGESASPLLLLQAGQGPSSRTKRLLYLTWAMGTVMAFVFTACLYYSSPPQIAQSADTILLLLQDNPVKSVADSPGNLPAAQTSTHSLNWKSTLLHAWLPWLNLAVSSGSVRDARWRFRTDGINYIFAQDPAAAQLATTMLQQLCQDYMDCNERFQSVKAFEAGCKSLEALDDNRRISYQQSALCWITMYRTSKSAAIQNQAVRCIDHVARAYAIDGKLDDSARWYQRLCDQRADEPLDKELRTQALVYMTMYWAVQDRQDKAMSNWHQLCLSIKDHAASERDCIFLQTAIQSILGGHTTPEQLQDLTASVSQLEKISGNSEVGFSIRALLPELAAKQGNCDKALRLIRILESEPRGRFATEALQNAEAITATTLYNAGCPEAIEKVYGPGLSSSDVRRRFSSHFGAGASYFSIGKLPQALAQLQAADCILKQDATVSSQRDKQLMYSALGKCLTIRGNNSEALQCFQESLNVNATNRALVLDNAIWLGCVYDRLGQYRQALAQFKLSESTWSIPISAYPAFYFDRYIGCLRRSEELSHIPDVIKIRDALKKKGRVLGFSG